MEPSDKFSILGKIEKIDSKLRKLKNDKKKIQKECNHSEGFYLAFSEEDRNSIRVYCSMCKKQLRYPTKDEIHQWVGKNK